MFSIILQGWKNRGIEWRPATGENKSVLRSVWTQPHTHSLRHILIYCSNLHCCNVVYTLIYTTLFVCFIFCIQVEKRLDLVKQVSHSTHKKLTACLQGQQGTDLDKRSVKSPAVSQVLHLSYFCFLHCNCLLS